MKGENFTAKASSGWPGMVSLDLSEPTGDLGRVTICSYLTPEKCEALAVQLVAAAQSAREAVAAEQIEAMREDRDEKAVTVDLGDGVFVKDTPSHLREIGVIE